MNDLITGLIYLGLVALGLAGVLYLVDKFLERWK